MILIMKKERRFLFSLKTKALAGAGQNVVFPYYSVRALQECLRKPRSSNLAVTEFVDRSVLSVFDLSFFLLHR